MRYRSTIKIERYTNPVRIEPDGYSSIEILNESATETLLIDGMLSIPVGGSYAIENQPYVTMDSYIIISPKGTEPFICVVVKTYFSEVE